MEKMKAIHRNGLLLVGATSVLFGTYTLRFNAQPHLVNPSGLAILTGFVAFCVGFVLTMKK